MNAIAQWAAQLESLPRGEWPAFLDAHSHLPGPRGNIELVAAVAPLLEPPMIEELQESGDEFRGVCAAAALGRRAADATAERGARELACDERWRVREGVAIGLQLLGDSDPAVVFALVLRWVDDPRPLVQRAAAAAVCEPRLLRTPEAAAVAVEVCRRATAHLAATPAAKKKLPDFRVLRQALGYCWSVAVAADPEPGLAAFATLDTSDHDVAWIVAENRRKKRLASLL